MRVQSQVAEAWATCWRSPRKGVALQVLVGLRGAEGLTAAAAARQAGGVPSWRTRAEPDRFALAPAASDLPAPGGASRRDVTSRPPSQILDLCGRGESDWRSALGEGPEGAT